MIFNGNVLYLLYILKTEDTKTKTSKSKTKKMRKKLKYNFNCILPNLSNWNWVEDEELLSIDGFQAA